MKRPPVELVSALRAICDGAKLRNVTRAAEAPRLVGERGLETRAERRARRTNFLLRKESK